MEITRIAIERWVFAENVRVTGVATPPMFGLTSEEVRERSLPSTDL